MEHEHTWETLESPIVALSALLCFFVMISAAIPDFLAIVVRIQENLNTIIPFSVPAADKKFSLPTSIDAAPATSFTPDGTTHLSPLTLWLSLTVLSPIFRYSGQIRRISILETRRTSEFPFSLLWLAYWNIFKDTPKLQVYFFNEFKVCIRIPCQFTIKKAKKHSKWAQTTFVLGNWRLAKP